MEETSAEKPKLEDRLFALIESLFKELDQDSIHREVQALAAEHPDSERRELARKLTRKAALSASAIGAGAGAAGGALGVLAMAPDIFNLVRLQSRLILSIAFLYGQKPHLRERFKEVLATLAISTGASAGRQGVRYLLRAGLEGELATKVARRIAGKMVARKLPDVLPLVGSAAGAGLNYLAVHATGRAAEEYYGQLLESEKPPVGERRRTIDVTARTAADASAGKSVPRKVIRSPRAPAKRSSPTPAKTVRRKPTSRKLAGREASGATPVPRQSAVKRRRSAAAGTKKKADSKRRPPKTTDESTDS